MYWMTLNSLYSAHSYVHIRMSRMILLHVYEYHAVVVAIKVGSITNPSMMVTVLSFTWLMRNIIHKQLDLEIQN